MPTKRAAAKPAKPKKAEKPKLTAKKPAAKPVAAKTSAKPAPVKAPVAAAKPAPKPVARACSRREARAARQRHPCGTGDPQSGAVRTHRRYRHGRAVEPGRHRRQRARRPADD